jgi:hypothetical protein
MPNSKKSKKRLKQFKRIAKEVIPASVFMSLIRGKWSDLCLRPYKGLGYMIMDPCVYCGKEAEGWDHLAAQATHKGVDYNQARACKKCNGSKGIMSPLEFLVRRTQRLRYCEHMAEKVTCGRCLATQRYQAARQRLRFRRGRKSGVKPPYSVMDEGSPAS